MMAGPGNSKFAFLMEERHANTFRAWRHQGQQLPQLEQLLSNIIVQEGERGGHLYFSHNSSGSLTVLQKKKKFPILARGLARGLGGGEGGFREAFSRISRRGLQGTP